MNKKNLAIVGGVLILLVIAIIVYSFINSQQKTEFNTTRQTNSQGGGVEIQQQFSEDSYRNEIYEINFEYPENWQISEREVQGDLSVKLFPDSQSNEGSVTISVDKKPYAFCSSCSSLDEIKTEMTNTLQGSVQNLESNEIMINGNNAIELTYITSYDYVSKSIYFFNNEKIYTIAYLEDKEVANNYEEDYDKIINSFSI